MSRALPHRVALIADAHFHNPKSDFGGAGIIVDGERLALRSWKDTRNGARTVNETSTALKAALDRIAHAGIRQVILAGDYTDDGQVENTRSLAQLLQSYHDAHGMRVFVTPGNHDVFGPFGKHVSTRFVTGPSTERLVTSDPKVAKAEGSDAILTAAMRCEGQPTALLHMAGFGLFRQPSDLHWESPFGASDAAEARLYDAVSADKSVSHRLMDASYLVEPQAGLWLLMIDANVFEPRSGQTDISRKKAFLDPSNAGWNGVLRVKPFLLSWIKDVVMRATAANKTLVAVSHYPVLDPYQDMAGSELALFGTTSILRRTPDLTVGRALIATGLKWHAGGHMHVNATSTIRTDMGQLTDLSLPSLAAFPSAFKIIHASPKSVTVETIALHDVMTDPKIQKTYQMQGRAAQQMDYGSFLAQQFRSHITEDIMPRDWPPSLLRSLNGADCATLLELIGVSPPIFSLEHSISREALKGYPAVALISDAYLIRAAGQFAADFIEPINIRIARTFAEMFGDDAVKPHTSDAVFIKRFLSVLRVSLGRMSATDGIIWENTSSDTDA